MLLLLIFFSNYAWWYLSHQTHSLWFLHPIWPHCWICAFENGVCLFSCDCLPAYCLFLLLPCVCMSVCTCTSVELRGWGQLSSSVFCFRISSLFLELSNAVDLAAQQVPGILWSLPTLQLASLNVLASQHGRQSHLLLDQTGIALSCLILSHEDWLIPNPRVSST